MTENVYDACTRNKKELDYRKEDGKYEPWTDTLALFDRLSMWRGKKRKGREGKEISYELIFFDTASNRTYLSLGKSVLLNLSLFCNTIWISNLLPSTLRYAVPVPSSRR